MKGNCSDCSQAIAKVGKSGRCKRCQLVFINSDPETVARRAAAREAFNGPRRVVRSCPDCGGRMAAGSTRCRTCSNRRVASSPEVRAKAAATFRMNYNADPARQAEHRARVRATVERARIDNPAFFEARRENGRRHGPRNIDKSWAPEARAKAGRSISARRLAHIPSEYRDLYRDLTKQDLTAAERERIVLDHAARDRARIAAEMAALQPKAEESCGSAR
ncbi:hypothetical protein [Sphingomonas azotifigens]|uniref:hypothetical protein n=1 Tax=Sphingomonas azotifigens TaxID=330920 RepID=UPI00111C0B05|nr:hypothetical protein [Sphingomonas azotifigens]